MRRPGLHRAGRGGAALAIALGLLAGCVRPHPPPPRSAGRDAPLLWRVTRGGAVSYVFGTVHLGRDAGAALGDAGGAALRRAATVVVELDLEAADTRAAIADVVARRGTLPPGADLAGMVSPATWHWLVATLRSSLPEPRLRRTRPWLAVYLVLAQRAAAALAPAAGRPPLEPMDQAIVRAARARGQRVIALETAAEQIEALAAMDDAEAVAFLEEAAQDPAALDRQLRGVVAGASGPDAAARVERMVADFVAESPAMAEALFFDRTARWVPRLVPLLRDGGAFVAVGAGHLVGDRGLLALLAAKGFAVRRVAVPAAGASS